MTPWFDGRMLAIDFETTGVDPEQDRIVQAAVWLVGGGLEREGFTVLIDPGVPIAEGASAVHGITNERAKAEGLAPFDALERISAAIDVAILSGYPLVAFNARFDLTMLDRECRRHGNAVPEWERARVVDPLVIDKFLDRYRKGSRKLAAICATYGAKLGEAHAAEDDAIAAARAAWVLGAKGQVVRKVWDAQTGAEKAACVRHWNAVRGDLDMLHEAQRVWAGEQAVGLAEHFRKTGKPGADEVRTEWPLIPVAVTA